MKYLTKIPILLMVMIIHSCDLPKQNLVSRFNIEEEKKSPIVQFNYFQSSDSIGKSPEVFVPPVLHAGQNKIFFPKSIVEIQSNYPDSLPIGIRLAVSKTRSSEDGFDTLG